jgi:hypothetical protein
MNTDAHNTHPNGSRITTQLIVWALTVIFLAGVVYGTFATKDYVDAKYDRMLEKIDQKLERIESKLDRKQDRL